MRRASPWLLPLLAGCPDPSGLGGQEGSEYTESDTDIDTDADTDTDTDSDADTDTDTDTDPGRPNPYTDYTGSETLLLHTGPYAPEDGYQCLLTLAVDGSPIPFLPEWCEPDCVLAFNVAISAEEDLPDGCDAELLGLSAMAGAYAYQAGVGLWFQPADGSSGRSVVDTGATFSGGLLEYAIEEGTDPATTKADAGAVYRLREGAVTVE